MGVNKLQIFILTVLVSFTAHAEIYKWTDEKGNVHYGDRPANSDHKQLNISEEDAGASPKVSSAERAERRQKLLEAYKEDRKEKQEAEAKEKKRKDKLNKQCNYAKDRLKNYKTAGGLYKLDKDGNRVSMSEEYHQKRIKELSKQIKKHCN